MSLRERLETIRSSSAPPNEETAKLRILAPILQSLDWDPYGPEVLYEHPVGGKRRGGRVDIALKSAGKIVALIEAKSPGTDLAQHVEQVLNYAFHDGLDICVLTTGLEWWLYLPRESGPPQQRRFAILNITEDPLDQLVEDFDAFLSKEKLLNGQAESRAKAVRKAGLEAAKLNNEVPKIWQEILRGPHDELVELLGKQVYDKLNLRPTKPQLVAALRGSPIPSANVPVKSTTKTPPSSQSQQTTKPQKPKSGTKPIAMELWGERYDIKSHRDAYKKVLDLLYKHHNHEFHRVLEIRGRKNLYVARKLELLNSDGQYRYYEPQSSGYFFALGYEGTATLMRRARQFLELFGHDSSGFEILYQDSFESEPSKQQDILPSKPVAMELWGQHYEVGSHADAFRKVIDLLFERHSDEFHRLLELRGNYTPYVARNPEMLSSKGKKNCYEPFSSGYFFNVNGNGKMLRGRTRKFLKLLGHEPDDFKILYE